MDATKTKTRIFTVKLNKNGGGLPYNYHPDVIYYTGSCQIDSTRLYIIVNGNTYSAYNTWRDEIEHEINESQTVSICVANDRKYNGGGKSTVQNITVWNIMLAEWECRHLIMSAPLMYPVCVSTTSRMAAMLTEPVLVLTSQYLRNNILRLRLRVPCLMLTKAGDGIKMQQAWIEAIYRLEILLNRLTELFP